MRCSATFALLGFVASAAAQTVHTVIVGGPGQLTYTPACLWPAVGDIVNFEFREKNHTATQSSFAEPCKKLTDAAGVQNAFDSGYQPVAAGTTAGTTAGFPVMSFNVTDDKPKWFYCAQGSHCSAGMVFAINPPKEGNTFEAFLANAKNSATQPSAPPVSAPPATTTAAATVTPAPDGVVTVTQTVTLGASTWTTTYGSAPGSAAPTPNPQPVVHVVTVGENGTLTFNPPSVQAAPRDIISFQFKSKNHTITQSTFADPCRKFEFTSTTGQIGFDSGFVPVTADASAFPTWNVTVNDTAPVWAYCRQGNHCGAGMVFALNAVEGGNRSFAAFQALAKQINGTGSGTPASSTSAPSATASSGPSVNGASHLIVAGSWVGIVTSLFMIFL